MPRGYWKTTTFVTRLRRTGIAAPMVLDGPINRDAFHAYVGQMLVPELNLDNVVIMDEPSSHKAPGVREMMEAAGASLLYLSPYSPDFNPIGQTLSKLNPHLRKAAERTIYGIGCILDLYFPAECANYFANAGYDAVPMRTALASDRRA